MVKQFLLNHDGSVPKGANVARLMELNIPLVLPTPRWRPEPGMMLIEVDPQPDAAGVMRQTWVEVPVPEPVPQDEEPT